MTVSADARDDDGVQRVDFYYHVDARTLLGSSGAQDPPIFIGSATGSPPYHVNWSIPRECTATVSLSAEAFNNCGNQRLSAAVVVQVCNR